MASVIAEAPTRVLVTGATGFVGRALCNALTARCYTVRRAVRKFSSAIPPVGVDTVETGELGPETDWSQALAEVSIVFHLAARTHVLRETSRDACTEYRRINVDGTRALVKAAIAAQIRRIVFLSSIKVNGESTDGLPFTESMVPHPEDAYGASKWEAEQVLREMTRGTQTACTILRSPLVYGPGVKGNFLRLVRWAARGAPLPLASIDNKRSLIFVENLTDALVTAGFAPEAGGKTYLVSDGEDVSTLALFKMIASELGVPARALPCPPPLLIAGGRALGKGAEIRRLTGSLQINSALIRRELAWAPPYSLAQGLAQTAGWYHSQLPVKSIT